MSFIPPYSLQKCLNRKLILSCSHWVTAVAANTLSIPRCCVVMGNNFALFLVMPNTTATRIGWFLLHFIVVVVVVVFMYYFF